MRILRYTITGEVVPKKNSRIVNKATGRSFPSSRYVEWAEGAKKELRVQGIPKEAVRCCKLDLILKHGDNRRRDADNALSSVLDILVDSMILEDDNYKVVPSITIQNIAGQKEARCDIIITSAR